MSEISRDLQDQMNAGLDPLFRRFLEKKPGYDGPTLTADEEERLRRHEQVERESEMYHRQIKEALGR
jgi:hypothetical protein